MISNGEKKELPQKKAASKNLFFIGDPTDLKGQYDLAILANCNHTIQSQGSSTYFAGFLANGLKFIPENFAEYRLSDQKNAISVLDQNPLLNPLPKLYFFDQFK